MEKPYCTYVKFYVNVLWRNNLVRSSYYNISIVNLNKSEKDRVIIYNKICEYFIIMVSLLWFPLYCFLCMVSLVWFLFVVSCLWSVHQLTLETLQDFGVNWLWATQVVNQFLRLGIFIFPLLRNRSTCEFLSNQFHSEMSHRPTFLKCISWLHFSLQCSANPQNTKTGK